MPFFIHGPDISSLQENSSEKLSPIQTHLLSGYSELSDFLSTDISLMHSPFLLPDIILAIQSIQNAVDTKKHILLYGDRDTDGVSSTSLLAIYLRDKVQAAGGKLSVRTSSQNDDYGLCKTVMKNIQSIQPDLLVTLDFGSTNYDEINQLAEQGIEVIVLDHHEMPIRIPKCFLVNPKREDSIYPEKRICTSFLSLKLILAIEIYTQSNDPNFLQKNLSQIFTHFPTLKTLAESLSDLASIGTITDMMPLTGENRILVKNGLRTLSSLYKTNSKDRKGLRSLITELKLNPNHILSKDLGWNIGPALNAAGRMGQTEVALKLLLETDNNKSVEISKQLVSLNNERRERTKRNIYKVEKYFNRKPERKNNKIIFCYEPDMEPGVSGIVATKLVQEYEKPAVFITPDNGNAKGSVRAFKKENVIELFSLIDGLFIHSGGHPEAGGFSIKIEDIPTLERKLEDVADTWLDKYNKNAKVDTIESTISMKATELNANLFSEISILEPFGIENQQPLISVKNAIIINFKPMGDGTHARFNLLGSNSEVRCIIWNKAKELESFISGHETIDLWGLLESNYFNGSVGIQFIVEHYA